MAVASLTRLRRPANHYGARSGYRPPPSCKPTGRRRSPTRRATIGLTMPVSDDDRDPTYDDRNVTRRQTEYRGACEALLPLWLIGRFPPLPPPPTSSLGRLDQVYGIHA